MDKKSLTKLFLEQTGGDTSDKSIKECLVTWWVAPFSPIGLRLTPAGSKFLDKIVGLQKYKFKIKEDCPKTLKIMVQMNKYLQSPFYLYNDTIVCYGETDAVMMGLYQGDLQQYLTNFER